MSQKAHSPLTHSTKDLALAVEGHFRLAGVGIGFGIPQFEAGHDAVSLQFEGAGLAAGGNYIAYVQSLRSAVAIMDDDPVELDGSIDNPKLQKTVAACPIPYLDIVVVVLAVNMRGT